MSHFSKKYSKKGFTLIELLVSIGIMVFMLSVILSNQASYTGTATLNNSAGDIYLSLRQAQVYGVGVKEFAPGSEEFEVSYGMSFNTSSSGSDDAYIFFADRGGLNGLYDSGWDCPVGGTSECISKTTLNQRIKISEVCYIRISGPDMCNIGRADILFTRPSTEARISVFNVSGNYMDPQPDNINGVRIDLELEGNTTRSVMIYKTGQMSVQ